MPRRPTPGSGDLAASVRARLAAGRTMAALKEAKELAKRHPGDEAEALLAEAYGARVLDLAQQGLHGEAQAVLRVAAERFPDIAATWERAATLSARAAGNLDDLLLAYRNASADARAAVADELERALRDLGPVRDSDVLAPDDPLRLAAADLHAGFVAAADGGMAPEMQARCAASEVPAPLVAWRHFVLALDAFHRHADAEVRAELEHIGDDSGVAAGKRLLLQLLQAESAPGATPATRRVVVGITGGASAAYAGLATLRAGVADSAARREAARAVLTELAQRQPRAAARFVWYLRQHREHDAFVQELDHGLGEAYFGADWLRQTADLDAEDDPVLGLTTWLTWLMPEPRGDGLLALTDLELAEILGHLLPVARGAMAQVGEHLDLDVGVAVGDPLGLEQLLEPWAGREQPPETDYALTCATVLAEALRRLRLRTGSVPQLGDHRQLAEFAARLDPCARRFDSLLSCLERDQQDEQRAFLGAWIEALPDDAEPWLHLAAMERQVGRVAAADAALVQAASRAPDDPRVRTAELGARWAALRDHARAGDLSVAALAASEAMAEPCARDAVAQAALAAARHLLGDMELDDVSRLVDDPVRVTAALDAVRFALLSESVEAEVQGHAPREHLRRAAFLARMATFAPAALQLAQVSDVRFGRSDLPADPQDQLALCTLGAATQDWELVEAASGIGLAVDSPLLARFVYFRGLALLHLEEDEDVGHELLTLARHLATRGGDDDTWRAAEAWRRPLDDDFDETVAAAILADERAHEKGVRAVVADHTRPLTARERARQRREAEPPRSQPTDGGES
ncbi:MAG: hypothetical protein R3F56_00620 [Planctomycetota bacterium]